MDPAQRLAAWFVEHRIAAEQRVFEVSTHSVAAAALAVEADTSEFVKSICMVTAEDAFVVAVVKGEDRASTTRVGKLVGGAVRIATPDEMLARTGYPAGGTPPFGFSARFLVDDRVMERGHVWAGGGSDRALVGVTPAELLRANGGTVARVRK